MKFIDFFAGIGGFRRGMELAGHECVGFCEFDKFATASYISMHLLTEEQRKVLEDIPIKKRQKEILDELIVYAVWYEKYQCYIAIRKLTPRECFRLQGWSDDYFEKAQFVNFDSQLYKQAGNGVTVTVIETIARKMNVNLN